MSVTKENGETKLRGGEIAKDVNENLCPSYFTREYIEKLFD